MKKFLLLSFTACLLIGCNEEKQVFKTDYFKIEINRQGYIIGMWDNTKENRNFSPADNPSPLLSLYNSKEKKYYYPQKASYDRGIYRLTYENGSVADVKLEAKQRYFKLTLAHLENREQIDAIQWGSYYTNIDNLLGEIIGVARDTSAAVNYAIGALALEHIRSNVSFATCLNRQKNTNLTISVSPEQHFRKVPGTTKASGT